MSESIQKWLGRNRPPRVHITYDVETGGAIEMKELPFIVGILADLAGDNKSQIPLKERKFIEIDRDNFSEIMAKTLAPSLQVKVPDEIARAAQGEGEGEAKTLVANLTFQEIDDFRPESIAEQVSELGAMLAARRSLRDLTAQLDLRDRLEEQLEQLAAGSEEDLKLIEEAAEAELKKLLPAAETGAEGAPAAAAKALPAAAPPAAAPPAADKTPKKPE